MGERQTEREKGQSERDFLEQGVVKNLIKGWMVIEGGYEICWIFKSLWCWSDEEEEEEEERCGRGGGMFLKLFLCAGAAWG